MRSFEGSPCPVCGKAFEAGDDIVVCPVCGTPHHRACYRDTGACFYEDRHTSGWTFDQKQQTADAPSAGCSEKGDSSGVQVCPKCQAANPPDGLFCIVCGGLLSEQDRASSPQIPFLFGGGNLFSPDSAETSHSQDASQADGAKEIDGVAVCDFTAFVGPNSDYFLSRFSQYAQGKSILPNFCALFFPSLYFLYRKVWSLGVLFSLFQFLSIGLEGAYVFAFTASSQGGALLDALYWAMLFVMAVSFVCNLLACLFGNRLYYHKARKVISHYRSRNMDDQACMLAIQKRGSVSMCAVALGVGVLTAGTIVGSYLMLLFA